MNFLSVHYLLSCTTKYPFFSFSSISFIFLQMKWRGGPVVPCLLRPQQEEFDSVLPHNRILKTEQCPAAWTPALSPWGVGWWGVADCWLTATPPCQLGCVWLWSSCRSLFSADFGGCLWTTVVSNLNHQVIASYLFIASCHFLALKKEQEKDISE